MSRLLIQAVKGAAEIIGGTAAAESKLVSPLVKETAAKLGRPGAEIVAGETAAVNPLVKEAAVELSQPAADAARRTLTLGPGFKPPAVLNGANGVEKTVVQGRTGHRVQVENGRATFGDPHRQRFAQSLDQMSEAEANQYLNGLISSQDRIMAHNLKIAKQDPDSIGKFAQAGIFKPLQARFDALKTNKDLKLLSVGDGSALDAVGADALLVNTRTKHMWLTDVKPKPYYNAKLGAVEEKGYIPLARSNSVIEYEGTLFTNTGSGFRLNEHAKDFKTFIDQSAGKLLRLGENPSLFSVTKTPPPHFMFTKPDVALTGVGRFQKGLLQSGNRELESMGMDLNATLRYLRTPEALRDYTRMTRL